MDAPTPVINDINIEIKKEVISDKNNNFLIFIKTELSTELSIKAIKEDISKKTYMNKFSIDKIKENKYFIQFDDLKEICEEISQRFEKEKLSIIEQTNSIIISIPLPSSKIKEIIFELKENEKSEKDMIDQLISIVKEQKEQIDNLKKEIQELKEFKKQVSFLLKNYIRNLDSFIIDNNSYNSSIKSWINPLRNIKANLLYRMSRDGPEISTFHQLCDNKGPTLTLFDLKDGNKIGFYISNSFDSNSGWKKDEKSFIFNLNQNTKYKKINPKLNAFCCFSQSGPSVNGLGCNDNVKLNYIYHSRDFINNCYENGSKILPSIKYEQEYEVIEEEIFQILID